MAAILITKEGSFHEIIPRWEGNTIIGYYINNFYKEVLFKKCPKGYCVKRTETETYDIYINPYETVINPYMVGFDVRLKNKIIGDVIIVKRKRFEKRYVLDDYFYSEFANMYYVYRPTYSYGPFGFLMGLSKMGRLMDYKLRKFGKRRRIYSRATRTPIYRKRRNVRKWNIFKRKKSKKYVVKKRGKKGRK